MFNEHDFYGDKHRWFVAKVVNRFDPQMQGRIQIHIDGIHSNSQSDIPLGGLPWAQTLLPTTEGGTSGIGRISQLLPNALVFGIFLDGETSQLPLILGHFNQFETPTTLQRTTSSQARSSNNLSNVTYNSATVSNDTRTAGSSEETAARRWAAMNFFARDNGSFYTVAQAAGIVGNLEAESSFVANAVNENDAGPGKNSEGLAQWNRGRLEALKVYANKAGLDWTNFNTQLLYVDHELRGRPLPGPGNDGASSHASVYNMLRSTTTHFGGVNLSNSTWVICRYYEIPQAPESRIPTRDNFARTAYNQYIQSVSRTTSGPQ